MSSTTSLMIINEREEVLACREGAGFSLPQVNVESGRAAISLSRAVREQLQLDVFCLVLRAAASNGLQALRLQSAKSALPPGHVWINASEVPEQHQVQLVIDEAHMTADCLGGYAWYSRATAWLEEKVGHLGRTIRALEQWNGRVGGVLIKVSTDRCNYWFKSVSEFNEREYGIAQLLAAKHPSYFPRVVAIEPSWNAFLLEHVEGTELDDSEDVATWVDVAALLASMQMSWVGASYSLLRAGAADLRAVSMMGKIPTFLGHVDDVMARQPSASPGAKKRLDLEELSKSLYALNARVATLPFADGLANADFSPHNTLITSRGPIFIDWAEACVSLPLIVGEYMWRRMVVESPTRARWQDTLRATYFGAWAANYGTDLVECAAQMLPAFSVLAAAMFHHERSSVKSTENERYLRSLVRLLSNATKGTPWIATPFQPIERGV